jgi:hypothetical protein
MTVNDETVSKTSTATETDDSVWLMSYKELTGATQTYASDEGEQYAWFSGKVTNPTGKNAAIAGLCYTRPGSEPSALDDAIAWLRSPHLNDSSHFLNVYSGGGPNNLLYSCYVLGICPALAM